MRILLSAIILFVSVHLYAQPTIKILESGKRVSIRGLSVVDDNIVWASGTGGNVARSTDGGNTFTWMKVPGYEKMDFRDIEAFDKDTAIIMGITSPAVILKTKDGGTTWQKVFEDTTKGAFIDAMDFGYRYNGQVIGDPFGPSFYTLYTSDHGDTWKKSVGDDYGNMNDGEAFFASSGTNIKLLGNHPVIVSGGKVSRLFWKEWYALPLLQGKESTGANSVAVDGDIFSRGKIKAVVVGGDFSHDTISTGNCVLVDLDLNSKAKISLPETSPHGYRSCVIYLDKKHLLTCGTSGVDFSNDGGNNWELITKDGFHVCQKAKKGKAVFLAGNGKIAKLVMP